MQCMKNLVQNELWERFPINVERMTKSALFA